MTLQQMQMVMGDGGSNWSLVDSAFTQIAIGAGTGNTINMPSRASGDLLVYWDFTSGNSSTPFGWTSQYTGNIDVRTKISNGSETLTNATAPTANYDIFAMVASFRHAGGDTPTFVKGAATARGGATDFVAGGIAAGGTSYDDCLVVYCSMKSGAIPTNTTATSSNSISLRSGTTIMNTSLIRNPEDDYYPITIGFYNHLGGCYATGHDASAIVDEWGYNYSQWYIGTGGEGSTGYTMVFRGA